MRLSFNKTILTPSDLKSIKSVIENQGIEYIETSDKIEFDCTSITNAYEFGVLIGKFRRENEIMDRLLFTDTFVKKIKNEQETKRRIEQEIRWRIDTHILNWTDEDILDCWKSSQQG